MTSWAPDATQPVGRPQRRYDAVGRRPTEGNEWFLAAISPSWNTMESRFICSSVATVAHLPSSSLAGREVRR
uniref:Uncharacterized protein n=1 Tax=Plectus sambesii TaxID=2011161 RepID=A0A914UR35_9BILA